MGKEAITVTIDRHLHQWIKEKGGNKSRVVNQLLSKMWHNDQNRPKGHGYATPLAKAKDNFDEHMRQLNEVLDEMGELE
jgi:hypothetical protein